MSEKRLQLDRVLAALVAAGPRGLTQVDFDPPNVIDGGKPILRLAARIYDLKHERGAVIRKNGWRQKCAVYVLESVRPGTAVTVAPEQDASLVAEVAVVPEPTRLFDPVPVAQRASPYDVEAA